MAREIFLLIFFSQQFSTSDLSRVMHDEVCFNMNYIANTRNSLNLMKVFFNEYLIWKKINFPSPIENCSLDSFEQKGRKLLFNILNLRSLRRLEGEQNVTRPKWPTESFLVFPPCITLLPATCVSLLPENLITVKFQWLSNWKGIRSWISFFERGKRQRTPPLE